MTIDDWYALTLGVNDTDKNSGAAVFNQILEMIDFVQDRFKVKVVISEITPRKFTRDDEVKVCNRLLNELVGNKEDVFIARHSNLRDPEGSFFYDEKHIKASCIGRYCANIKRALRKAHGIPDRVPGQHHDCPNQNRYNPQWTSQHRGLMDINVQGSNLYHGNGMERGTNQPRSFSSVERPIEPSPNLVGMKEKNTESRLVMPEPNVSAKGDSGKEWKNTIREKLCLFLDSLFFDAIFRCSA